MAVGGLFAIGITFGLFGLWIIAHDLYELYTK